MENIVPTKLQRGTLLIASPEIESGMFFRGVILLCEHSATGSFGLLINKPLEFELPEELLNLANIVNPHVRVLAGGPVQSNQMMLLHTHNDPAQQMLSICPNVYLGGDLPTLQEMLSNESGPHLNLCFGYAGWMAGQLEREFLDGSWFIHPSTEQIVFHIPPEKLWRTLLREMGGKYATLSMIPDDLSVN